MIKIITVGKIKENYLKDAVLEYIKRLSKYTKLEIVELNDISLDNNKIILEKEKEQIVKYINKSDYIISLDLKGKMYDSIELANHIDKIFINYSNITFIIGGSYGLHPIIKEMSNELISFSKLTFPHQLFRVMLLEQIYRAYKIKNNETYHK